MPDLDELGASRLWSVSCRYARCMFHMAGRNPFASDRFAREHMRQASLRLTARVFESYEAGSDSLRRLHLAAAGESASELHHYLWLADRSTAVPPLELERARALADELRRLLDRHADDALALGA